MQTGINKITHSNHPNRKYIINNKEENLKNRLPYAKHAVWSWGENKDKKPIEYAQEQKRLFQIEVDLIEKELMKH